MYNRDEDRTVEILLTQIDWGKVENKDIAYKLAEDAKEYIIRVVDHIYIGNEIRSDRFMDASDKQDAIKSLDRKRTAAHDQMLKSFSSFIQLLKEKESFNEVGYRIENRTQIADFVSLIALKLIGIEPETKVEGDIRDEFAERIHSRTISFEQIKCRIDEIIGRCDR